LQGELRSAQADRDEAVGVYNNAVTQALQEVANAIVSQKALSQQIQKLQEATDAASEAHRIIHNRYRVGLASYLDVLMAEEALLASQHALRDLQSRSFIVDVALIKALGGGYQTQPQ
jgi:outer membrane protein TolC